MTEGKFEVKTPHNLLKSIRKGRFSGKDSPYLQRKGYLCPIFEDSKLKGSCRAWHDNRCFYIFFNKQDERNYKEGFVA